MTGPTLVTIEEAAQAVGVHPRTLVRWENQGYIHHIRRKNGIRYYAFENISQLIDLKRQPYGYLLQMQDGGVLPLTLRVIGDVVYGDGSSSYWTEVEEIPVGGSSLCVDYTKRALQEKTQAERCRKPMIQVYLNHHQKDREGPITWRSGSPFISVNLGKSSVCEAAFSMSDIWEKKSKPRLKYPDNTQTIPPKSFVGFESIMKDGDWVGRFVIYEWTGGQQWLAEEEVN